MSEPSSPKSDSELTIKSSENIIHHHNHMQWTWGELPEATRVETPISHLILFIAILIQNVKRNSFLKICFTHSSTGSSNSMPVFNIHLGVTPCWCVHMRSLGLLLFSGITTLHAVYFGCS